MSSTTIELSNDQWRRKLTLQLKNGIELFGEKIKEQIEENKLPFEIAFDDKGEPYISDLLSSGQLELERFITVDPDTIEMKRKASLAAMSDYDLLISGPTGTGKEIIARSQIGKRSGAIKSINCAGIPEGLVESTLFGNTKGAFTGAYTEKKGLIQEAENGIMFLDEVGELPVLMQAKLLRVIQEKKVIKVGGTTEEPINCKFVYATNKSIEEMVQHGTFRADLFARISMLSLDIRPLVNRLCDAIPIAKSIKNSDKFLEKYGERLEEGSLDLRHNVRSIQQMVTRYNVWGDIK